MEKIYCDYCNSLIVNNERCSSCGAPITKNNKIVTINDNKTVTINDNKTVTINDLRKVFYSTRDKFCRGGCRL